MNDTSTRPLVNLWNDFDAQLAFEYPYETPNDIRAQFKDPYCRNLSRLLASLQKFCAYIMDDKVHIVDSQNFDLKIAQPVDTCTRLYDNKLSEKDFDAFLDVIKKFETKNSVVIDATILQKKDRNKLDPRLSHLSEYEEVIFYQSYSEKKWVILRVSISHKLRKEKFIDIYMDGYFLGNVTRSEVEPLTIHVQNILNASFPYGTTIAYTVWRRRVHVPLDFTDDNVLLTYLIVHYLQRHGNYLDISQETILHHQLTFSSSTTLLAHHDSWLGRLRLDEINSSRYPFVTEQYKGEDDLSALQDLGWQVVDVEGDGNCGYYAMLLGLENLEIMDYHVDTADQPPMKMTTKNPWREKLIQLRKDLRKHSEDMLDTIYPEGTRELGDLMWFLAGVIQESDIEGTPEDPGLSQAIAIEEPVKKVAGDSEVPMADTGDANLAEVLPGKKSKESKKKPKTSPYFRSDFRKRVEYHMNPNWVPHVLASKFKIRVIIYLMLKDDSQQITWSSVSFEYMNDTHKSTDSPHVQVIWNSDPDTSADLSSKRVSDEEFKRVPTIEILYIHSHAGASGHFQYLQRILCSGVPMKPVPSMVTLFQKLRVQYDVSHWNESQSSLSIPSTMVEPSPASPHQPSPVTMVEPSPTSPPQPTLATTVEQLPASTPATMPQPKTITKAKVVVRPMDTTGKRKSKKAAQKEIIKKAQVTKMFNVMMKTGELKRPTRMKYKSSEDSFYFYIYVERNKNEPVRGELIPDDEIDSYHPKLLMHAMEKPDTWVGPTCEDANTGDAPLELCTYETCLYQQHNNPYCIIYSFASAVRYCGFVEQAVWLHNSAPSFPTKDFDEQIAHLLSLTAPFLPLIGGATFYGRRTNRHDRKKRVLDWETLFSDLTIYPTIVIPILRENGQCTHAFCVVDDLIFDSTTPCALKLGMDSVRWLFRERETDIYEAYRFNVKVSPSKKNKVKGKYEREMRLHD